MNVFLNNRSAMGEYDLDKLGELIKSADAEIEEMGFDYVDVQLLFDDAALAPMFDIRHDKPAQREAEWFEDAYQMRREHRQGTEASDDGEFYAVVVFRNNALREEFLHRLECSRNERTIDGMIAATYAGIDIKARHREEDEQNEES